MTNIITYDFSNGCNYEVAARPNRALRKAWASDFTLPAQYSNIDSEEMKYIDGGVSVPRGAIGGLIDFALATCFAVTGISAGFLGVKMLGKKASVRFLTKMAPSLFQAAGWAMKALGGGLSLSVNLFVGQIGNLLLGNLWALTSIGNATAFIFDYLDGLDGKIVLW